jgi:hypothetical protein
MKKLLYLSLLTFALTQSSCTVMVKGLAKLMVKDYNDYTDVKFSDLQIANHNGNIQLFGERFKGKTVYLYIWKNEKSTPPSEKNEAYKALKERFAKYPDVVFANLYIGTESEPDTYRLVENDLSRKIFDHLSVQDAAPFIIGKDGAILSYKGPKAEDRIVVDYVLFEARNGQNGTKSAKRLIKGVNHDQQFKTEELRNWYTSHFGKAPDKLLNFSISTSK